MPASAPSPGGTASATALATTPDSGTRTDRPDQNVLEEQGLDAATYAPGDPAACGLPSVATPDDLNTSVRVFFGCTPAAGPVLSAVPTRQVLVLAGTDPKEAALHALLAGPSDEEKNAGSLSNFGASSRDVKFEIESQSNGLTVVNLDPAIRNVPFIFVSNMDAAQIVATLGQFPDVKRVTILVGGQLLCQVTEQC